MKGAYANSANPSLLNIGLVQQNCLENCKTGVMEDGKVHDTEPDEDCYDVFCKSEYGDACEDGRVRVIKVSWRVGELLRGLRIKIKR